MTDSTKDLITMLMALAVGFGSGFCAGSGYGRYSERTFTCARDGAVLVDDTLCVVHRDSTWSVRR